MDVVLEAIKFNHDPTSATNDAFNIRRNETEPVVVPEWRRGVTFTPEDSPAAYARDSLKKEVVIHARFLCSDSTAHRIWVQALDGSLGGNASVLGIVPPTEVSLNAGQSGFVPITLERVRIAEAGISASDVIWRWQFSLNPKGHQAWTDLTTTRHRIYTVLDLPTEPWKPLGSELANIHVPWTRVLEVACRWAAGAQDVDAAAGVITEEVNRLGDKVTWDASPSFVREGTDNFLLTDFLDLIASPPTAGMKMNCSDCATSVSTFSNLLGASLSQSCMGYRFYFYHVRKIGEPFEDGGSFNIHEVAWQGNCTKDEALFDACLQLDGDPHPESDPFEPLLPKKMPFDKYLLQFKRKNVGNPCEARPDTKRRRKIGTSPLRMRLTSPSQLAALEELYHYASWKTARLSASYLFVWHWFSTGAGVPGWHIERTHAFNTADNMPATQESWWVTDTDANQRTRINTYECGSLAAAHAFALTVLGEKHTAFMKREAATDRESFGDVAFMNLDGSSILFARGNLVITAKTSSGLPFNLGAFLHEFDSDLEARPDADKKIEFMDHFRFPAGEFVVGDRVPLEYFDAHPPLQPKYKFFSELGQIIGEGNKLSYQPEAAGTNRVDVFEIRADRTARQQQLQILIEEK